MMHGKKKIEIYQVNMASELRASGWL